MTNLSTRNETHEGTGSAMLPEGWAQYPLGKKKHLKLNKLFILLQLWNTVSLTTAELIPPYSGSCEAWDPEFITKLSQTFPLGTWLTLCPEKNPLIRTSYSRGELICAVLNLPVVSYKALPQAQLSEDVYHNLHWGVVCYCKRAHIKDASQF